MWGEPNGEMARAARFDTHPGRAVTEESTYGTGWAVGGLNASGS